MAPPRTRISSVMSAGLTAEEIKELEELKGAYHRITDLKRKSELYQLCKSFVIARDVEIKYSSGDQTNPATGTNLRAAKESQNDLLSRIYNLMKEATEEPEREHG